MKAPFITACALLSVSMPAADPRSYYAGGTNPDGSPRTVTHVVQEGETLFHIAAKHLGSPYAAEKVAKSNGIKDPLQLAEGMELRLPVMAQLSIAYTIEKIAKDELLQHNPGEPMQGGDSFFMRVSSNMPGYLYAFNRHSGGEIERLFPLGQHAVRIEQFVEYLLPGKGMFVLDSEFGDEDIWVLVSRKKLDDIDAVAAGSDTIVGDAAAKVQAYLKQTPSAKGVRVADEASDESATIVAVTESGENVVLVHQIKIRRK